VWVRVRDTETQKGRKAGKQEGKKAGLKFEAPRMQDKIRDDKIR
jgi:predicted transposase YdaD